MVAELNQLPDVSGEIATTDADGPRRQISVADLPDKASIHVFRRTFSEQWKLSLGLHAWLQKNAGQYDLLHIHTLWSFSSAVAARAAKRHGIPYIVRPAGMLSPYTWSRGRLKKNAYWIGIERATIRDAAGFHVTSDDEAAEVRWLRSDANTFVIPNGVEPAAFTEPRMTTHLRNRCETSAQNLPILLFLSRLHPKKGILDRLLPAVAAMRTSCLLAIVGDEDSRAQGYEAAIQNAIKGFGLENRVAMLGPVFGNERWALFDGAAAFVLPSHSENFGIVVAEAMARGCPVVITKEVQAAALVTKAGAGIVVDGDAEGIAAALDFLLKDDEQRATVGARGHRFALQHLRWSCVAEKLRSMYCEILAVA
jgi:glycosyltransferase involved in cell wall biosynthesis